MNHLKDLDEKSLFKEVLKRPGLYVGYSRLDSLRHFVDGFMMHQSLSTGNKDNGFQLKNYEMQRWLLGDQSIVIRRSASINGWTLFFRCFGSEYIAISNFVRYLHADVQKPDDRVDAFQTTPVNVASDVSALFYSLKNDDADKCGSMIIALIKELLHKECTDYDLIRIYIKREGFFCQIHFIYHTPSGWKDDSSIMANPENYESLIKLHAHVECVEDIELLQLSKHDDYYCTFSNQQQYDNVFDIDHTITEDISYYTQYEHWKTRMTSTF